jgi:hypothetical protein
MSLKQDYERLSTERSPYLLRARDCSKFTLPSLVPPQGSNGSTRLRTTYSSFGARCVNSLASKLLLALFPARQSFFRLSVSKKLKEQMGGDKMEAEIQKALSSVEQEVMDEVNASPVRTPAGEAVKHLLVAGNVLVHLQQDGGLKFFPIHSYVTSRDDSGNPLRIIVEERMAVVALPEDIKPIVMAKVIGKRGSSSSEQTEVFLYTGITRVDNQWKVSQECEGVPLHKSAGTYPLDACPWFPLRWTPDPHGDYGRGLVEDYLGHLVSLESLTASLVKGTAVAAKVVFLRNPNAVTKAIKLTQAETGAVVDGKPDDVVALQVDKRADFQTAQQMIQDLKEELAYAFVMNQAVQRNAERVTAEEIRFMAQELDTTLGGNYSTLAMDFQLPYLRVQMAQMQKQGKLPMLPKGSIRPIIVTGLDALGRGADLDNLRALVKDVVDLGGPDSLKTYINFDNLLTRLATARGVTPDGLIKDAEQVAQEQQQEQQMQMMQQLGPNAVNALGGMAKQGMANAAAAPTPPQ